MDPVRNPYSRGAGTPPPELAGRDDLREQVRIALERVRAGRSTKSVLMVGLRGVGKTVLLDRIRPADDPPDEDAMRRRSEPGGLPALVLSFVAPVRVRDHRRGADLHCTPGLSRVRLRSDPLLRHPVQKLSLPTPSSGCCRLRNGQLTSWPASSSCRRPTAPLHMAKLWGDRLFAGVLDDPAGDVVRAGELKRPVLAHALPSCDAPN
jgi:hypothetical protein